MELKKRFKSDLRFRFTQDRIIKVFRNFDLLGYISAKGDWIPTQQIILNYEEFHDIYILCTANYNNSLYDECPQLSLSL